MKTFTQDDWSYFNGAEPFDSKNDPQCSEITVRIDGDEEDAEAMLVADKNRIEIHFANSDGDPLTLFEDMVGHDRHNVLALANAIEILAHHYGYIRLSALRSLGFDEI